MEIKIVTAGWGGACSSLLIYSQGESNLYVFFAFGHQTLYLLHFIHPDSLLLFSYHILVPAGACRVCSLRILPPQIPSPHRLFLHFLLPSSNFSKPDHDKLRSEKLSKESKPEGMKKLKAALNPAESRKLKG